MPIASELVVFDRAVYRQGFERVCGVDEVGRGPLAGPVVAAAVVLDPGHDIEGLDDSKKLSGKRRAVLEPLIREHALAVAVAVVEPGEIDRINILRASLLAMLRAVDQLDPPPDCLLIDGVHGLDIELAQRTVVKGDSTSAAIAAASIIAKEHRDRLMKELDRLYPGYGLAGHMGYPTRAHREAIARLGPSPVHRLTFKGVREYSCAPPAVQQELFS